MNKTHKKYIIEHCLKYCLHRIKKHKDVGIGRVVSEEELEELMVSIGFKRNKGRS